MQKGLHVVPVLPKPRIRTFMGTTRRHFRRLMSVSEVKMSVTGFVVYCLEKAILLK